MRTCRAATAALLGALLAACGTGIVGSNTGAGGPPPPTVPTAPTGVIAAPGIRSATVSWGVPSSDGGSAVQGYTVSIAPPTSSAVVAVTGTAASVTGLSNGAAYTFSVSAFNAVGTGPASAGAAITTPDVPGAPTSVVATAGNQSANLSWTNPAGTGGSAITSYVISVSPPTPSAVFTVSGTVAAVTSLTNGTAYTFTVAAVNAVGTGPASAPSNAVTPAAPTVAPSNLAYSNNPAVYTVGTAIPPNFPSNSGGAVATYSVAPALPASLSLSAVTGVVMGTPTAVSSMAAYVVTASNSVGSTTASLSITVNAAPEPPGNLTYANNPAVYTVGTAISPNVPSSTGGVVASYSVSPALPAQLSLNTSTGVVTGTPMAASAATAYVVTASNSVGSTTASLSITVNAATTTGMFPLAISADKNGLVTAGGAPFVMTGDAAWSAIAQLDQTDALMYLNDRQSRGFNTILVNLVEHSFTSHTPNWRNAEGQVPFTGTVPGSCPNTEGSSVCNDMSTTNDAYFVYADWFLQQALARNMLVLLAPAYMGYAGAAGTDGWFNDMSATGTAKLSTYGGYLGARYNTAAYPNIIWVNGCDYTPTTSQLGWVTAIVNGLKDAGATQLMTAHWGGEPSFPGYGPSPRPPWLDVDTVYVTSPPDNYQFTLQGWQADNGVRPVFFIEGPYENEYTPPTSPLFLRSDMYQPLFSGEVGFVFGVDPVWNFWDGGPGLKNEYSNDGLFLNWQSALPSPGGMDAVRAAQFMAALGSPKLVPDVNNTFVTAGYSRGSDYALAARTSDGRLAVVYFTNTLTITVSMSQMAGSTTARWFDPSNASYTTVSGSPFANSGQATFTPPGRTADGSTDWVLVLQVS